MYGLMSASLGARAAEFKIYLHNLDGSPLVSADSSRNSVEAFLQSPGTIVRSEGGLPRITAAAKIRRFS